MDTHSECRPEGGKAKKDELDTTKRRKMSETCWMFQRRRKKNDTFVQKLNGHVLTQFHHAPPKDIGKKIQTNICWEYEHTHKLYISSWWAQFVYQSWFSASRGVCFWTTMHDRATDSNSFSISGAQWTNSWFQNLKTGFFINSMNVMSSPQGCGRLTMSLSSRTLIS